MNIQPGTYATGDWIVHAYYGVGQVKGIERKILDGEKKLFFKVKTFDGVYWLSVVKTDVEYIRPITSKNQIKQALTTIRKAPEPLPHDHNKRNKAITEAIKDTSLISKAEMLRNLHGKQAEAKLNFTEEDALVKLKKQFVNEWAVVSGTDRVELEEKLERALMTSAEKLEGVEA